MALEKPNSLSCFKQGGKWKNLFLYLKFHPTDPDGKINNNPPTHTDIQTSMGAYLFKPNMLRL